MPANMRPNTAYVRMESIVISVSADEDAIEDAKGASLFDKELLNIDMGFDNTSGVAPPTEVAPLTGVAALTEVAPLTGVASLTDSMYIICANKRMETITKYRETWKNDSKTRYLICVFGEKQI